MIDFDALKQQANILLVVEQYVKLKKEGSKVYKGICPFHEEHTPSFTVTPGMNLWKCFGCDKSGDAVDFVQEYEKISKPDAVRLVAEICGIPLSGIEDKRPAPHTPKREYSEPPRKREYVDPLTAEKREYGPRKFIESYDYLDANGALRFQVLRFHHEAVDGSGDYRKSFLQRRKHADGSWVWGIAAGKYVKRAERGGDWMPFDSDKDKGRELEADDLPEVERVLFGLPEVIEADQVFLVEGEKDALALRKLGFVATSASGGSGAPWLPSYTAVLQNKSVVFIPDADKPGQKFAAHVKAALDGKVAEFLMVALPTDHKDISNYLRDGHDAGDVLKLVEYASQELLRKDAEDRGLITSVEVVELFPGKQTAFLDATKRPKGIYTGFTQYDDLTLGLHKDELTILAARPAMGKTAIVNGIAKNIAAQGTAVATFNLEMSNSTQLGRLVCSEAKVDSQKFRRGYLNSQERVALMNALHRIQAMPLFWDDNPSATLEHIHEKLLRLIKEVDLGVVMVDFLQLMGLKNARYANNRQLEVGAISRGFKLMCKELHLPFIVLSQLSRECEKRRNEKDGWCRPILSDLRDSGEIEQNADNVAFLYRKEVYLPEDISAHGEAELIVAKQRNGPTGTAHLCFTRSCTRFENPPGPGNYDHDPEQYRDITESQVSYYQ